MNIDKLERYFNKNNKSAKIKEAIIYIENSSGDISWHKEYGDKTLDSLMLAASVTKLFTTTCILILYQEGKLDINDRISDYLEDNIIKNLHTYKGIDYSNTLTIDNLLHQDSGLPDFYLAGKDSLYNKVLKTDFLYSFYDALEWTKSMSAIFPPSTKKRAYYSDINFDLLGKIIEKITGLSYANACKKYIFDVISLERTFVATKETQDIPYCYYKDKIIKRNKLISSCFASGGVVTTARELMIFFKAFWLGKLFDKHLFERISKDKRLQLTFYPVRYAGGYMTIEAGIPFRQKENLVGHSGSTGSFAFYDINKDIFLVGDIPQMCDPSIAIRFVINSAIKL